MTRGERDLAERYEDRDSGLAIDFAREVALADHVLGDPEVGIYEQHRDLEHVRGLLGHTRIEMTQLYAQLRRCAQNTPWSSTR